MLRFPCPFCGTRDEREFRYEGQAGKARPENTKAVSDEDWSDYLHTLDNPMGESKEVWVHLPCQEYFLMTRDTVNMTVLSTTDLQGEH